MHSSRDMIPSRDPKELTNAALLERLRNVPTATAKEILAGLGVFRVDLAGLRSYGLPSAAGRVRTLRYLPRRDDLEASARRWISRAAVDDLNSGDVLVIDAMGAREGAVLGDMLGARASYLRAAGAVADGVVRDVGSFASLGLAVFARGTNADPAAVHLVPWERDVPIQCCGRHVEPGDWILADEDAVLVVPAAHAARVVELAGERSALDEISQRLLRAGTSLDGAYPLPPDVQSNRSPN
jgi:5-oxopent-3-ene-1,2,5-tricarboxylate decarboxylase / 2-hydroxyhepta-2,4-diene-1,7-dioate isomerase